MIIKKLSNRQITAIEIINQTPNISLREMSKKLNISIKTIQREFADMRNLGVSIKHEGGKTYGYWTIQI